MDISIQTRDLLSKEWNLILPGESSQPIILTFERHPAAIRHLGPEFLLYEHFFDLLFGIATFGRLLRSSTPPRLLVYEVLVAYSALVHFELELALLAVSHALALVALAPGTLMLALPVEARHGELAEVRALSGLGRARWKIKKGAVIRRNLLESSVQCFN